jgi:branched-chain amino acid transport system ATP-binding protein
VSAPSPPRAPALEIAGLTVGYGGALAVQDLSLTVGPGEVVALVGANGAGKTTTLLAVSGLLRRQSGAVTVLGGNVGLRSSGAWRLARAGLAHVPEDRGLSPDLTVGEHLRLAAGRRPDPGALRQVAEWFPALEPLARRRAGLLSGGEQQMLALARALVRRPRLLLVDELSLGLAPIVVQQLLPVVRRVATETGAGVLVVEQHVGMVLSVADTALLLSRGRTLAAGPAADLAARPELIESGYLDG